MNNSTLKVKAKNLKQKTLNHQDLVQFLVSIHYNINLYINLCKIKTGMHYPWTIRCHFLAPS